MKTSLNILVAMFIAASPTARADCPSDLRAKLYEPATSLARSWTALEILLSSPEGTMPPAWLPHSVVDANNVVLQNAGEDPQTPANGPTPEARWTYAYNNALTQFHDAVVACNSPDAFVAPTGEFGWQTEVFSNPDPTAVQALERFAQQRYPRSVLLTQSLGHVGGLPAVRLIQVNLAQTVSRGQPGFAPSIALNPFRSSTHYFARHLAFSASGLVMTPNTSSTPGVPAQPIFASAEAFIGSSSATRADDWYRDVLSMLARSSVDVDRIRANTLRRLVRDYAAAPLPVSPEDRKKRLTTLVQAATRTFQDDVLTYYEQEFIAPLERRNTRADWSVAVRGRVTPDATWVGDVVDLASVGAQATGQFQFADTQGLKFSLTGGAFLSGSGYPVATGWTRLAQPPADPSAQWSFLVDANAGLAMAIPGDRLLNGSAARLSASALWRWRPSTGSGFGFNAELQVPVSGNFALAGAFTLRCGESRRACDSTSSLSLAVATQ